jgi:SAM-dependent methyltransferase
VVQKNEDLLVCDREHSYPVIHGVPVMLVEEDDPTRYAADTLNAIGRGEIDGIRPAHGIDPVVNGLVGGTCGYLYGGLIDRLPRYPIPTLRLPEGNGQTLLDVGSGWGRWSLAASRAGYRAVALDPWLAEVLAAVRVSLQLDLPILAVVGDATTLPFANGVFDTVFSYSVLQHFPKDVAKASLSEMDRVTRSGGTVLVQLPNRWGLRQTMQRQLQRLGVRDTHSFSVRYWTPGEIGETFSKLIGPTVVEVDGYLSLNAQISDLDILPLRSRIVVRTSELLRRLQSRVHGLMLIADSLYGRATAR